MIPEEVSFVICLPFWSGWMYGVRWRVEEGEKGNDLDVRYVGKSEGGSRAWWVEELNKLMR